MADAARRNESFGHMHEIYSRSDIATFIAFKTDNDFTQRSSVYFLSNPIMLHY